MKSGDKPYIPPNSLFMGPRRDVHLQVLCTMTNIRRSSVEQCEHQIIQFQFSKAISKLNWKRKC